MDAKKDPRKADFIVENGVPKGIRTPVAAVKGQCPRPLDDGDEGLISSGAWWS